MCKNVANTTYDIIDTVVLPEVTSILQIEGISATASPIMGYIGNALEALKNWKQGTPSQDAIEALTDLQNSLQLLPVSATVKIMVNTTIATVISVIHLVTGNSPAPTTATSEVSK